MDGANVTLGWGAVAAFGRTRLNSLLRDQYLQRLNALRFLPLLNADIDHKDHIRTRSVLRKLEFGPPTLSFTNASVNDSKAELTFPIVAGTYLSDSPLAENLLTRFTISEDLGYVLVVDIDLSLAVGEVDRRGRVTLDLAQATAYRCNLMGHNDTVNALLAGAIQEHFSRLQHHQGRFELGMVDFAGYSPLTPTHFIIRTQAAPGAQMRGAANYGDGAVLTFIQLRGNSGGGLSPSSSFPYLLPDDRDGDGSERYTSALVIDKAMLEHATADRIDVLTSLLFPASHDFVERVRFTPHDLAIFGSIEPSPDLLGVDPPFMVIEAGERQQFRLRDRAGNEVQASSWKAVSRQSHSAVGDGAIDANGLYSSPAAQDLGYPSLTIIITAQYKGRETTAQLLVKFERTQIAPRVAVFAPQTPMDLAATLQGGAAIDWTLPGAQLGELDRHQGARVRFNPQTAASKRLVSVQQVVGKGADQRHAALVMLNGLQSLVLDPVRALNLEPGQKVTLSEREPDLLPGAQRRWQLIGPGTLDEDGCYKAASDNQQGTSVVTCELVQNGVVLAAGYSLLEVGEPEQAEDPTWTNVTSYTVKALGGGANDTKADMLNNGFQSLRVQVVIETEKAADGRYHRLSYDERASIGLSLEVSKQQVIPLDGAGPSEGLERDNINNWATRQVPNRFHLAYAQSASSHEILDNEGFNDQELGITRQDIYLHCKERGGVATSLYSSFVADRGGIWASTATKGEHSKIAVTPKVFPPPNESQYTWTRMRVQGGSSQTPGSPDDFNLHLVTLDYWVLGLHGSSFETCQFLPREAEGDPVSTSMIRWESENPQEIMFSFTGHIFKDIHKASEPNIQFDEDLLEVIDGKYDLNIPVDPIFAKGTFVVTNHRVMDFEWQSTDNDGPRDRLSDHIAVVLRDQHGNPHYRQIDFNKAGTTGHRNELTQTHFTPEWMDPVAR